jgi:hypothetical protein
MFSAIESHAQPPTGRRRHRPSIGRIFYWSYLLGVPLVAISVGVALLIASNQLDAAVQSYRNAPPCPAPTATACYALASGTLVKFTITHGKTGDTADMTLQLPDGTMSTRAKTNGQQEDALHVGAPIRAEFYQGTITAVYLGAVAIQTKDSPVYKQSDMRLGALLIPTLGLVIAAVSIFTLRGERQLAVGSLAQTPSVTRGAQPSVTLPFTLRPRPMPTGRPWWVALIAVAIGVPLLLAAEAIQAQHRGPGSRRRTVLTPSPAAHLGIVLQELEYRCPTDVPLAARSAPAAAPAWEPGDRDEQRCSDHGVTP